MPYRFLDKDSRFRKYQWITAQVTKAKNDSRPESFRLDLDSIRIATPVLSTSNLWLERKRIVGPLESPSLCALQSAQRENRDAPTLGFFKPKRIKRLNIKPDSREWTEAELARLRQYPLFGRAPAKALEKIPYTFKYEFDCHDPACGGHELSCLDWEIGQSFRAWSRRYSDGWEEKLRQRYELEMILRFDTHFFVGTIHQHPNSWIIVGLFYPPKPSMPPEPHRVQAIDSIKATQASLF